MIALKIRRKKQRIICRLYYTTCRHTYITMYASAMERIVRISLWLIEGTRKFLASRPAKSGGSSDSQPLARDGSAPVGRERTSGRTSMNHRGSMVLGKVG